MNSNTPTKEQLRAIADIDKSLPVTAGAGSGKTFVLTHRYFQILAEQKAALNEILTITFTEKATNQMKQKIRNLITAHARGQSNTDFPPVRKPGITRPDLGYWQDLLDNFEQSYISTIHGFCSRILRESAISVGLDPEFTVMDEHTTALRQPEIIRRAVFQLIYRENDAVAHWLQYYSASRIIQTMQTLVQKRTIYQGLLGYYLNDENEPLPADELFQDIKARYERTITPLLEQFKNNPVWQEFVPIIQGLENYDAEDRFYPHYRAILELIDQLESASGPIEQINIWIALADELKSKGSKKNWSEEFSDVKSLALDFRTEILEPALKGLTDFHEDDEAEAIRLAQSGAQIYAFVLEKYQNWKRKQNFMDYDDLLIQAVELLRNHDEIRHEYAGQFKHILVDEFQDTNPIQYELVELLRQSESEEPPKIFVVGDPKQSIYRFRGTEVSLFEQAKTQLMSTDAKLSKSFRSRPALLRWFDACFSVIMGTEENTDESLADYEQYYLPLTPFRDEGPSEQPSVCLNIVGTKSSYSGHSAQDQIQVEAAHLARWLVDELPNRTVGKNGIQRQARYGDVAMLFRRTTYLKQYEYALQLAGVPYYTTGGKGLFTKQEIEDILNVLRALADPADEIALVGTLRSAFFGLSDEGLLWLAESGYKYRWQDVLFGSAFEYPEGLSESDHAVVEYARRQMQSWKQEVDRRSPGRLIDWICTDTGYLGIIGDGQDGLRQIRNVEQFQEFAYDYSRSQQTALRAFLDYIGTLQEESEAEEAVLHSGEKDAVQLMTIHKSKGLEFPVVMVPNMDYSGGGGNSLQRDFYTGYGWGITWTDPETTERAKPVTYRLVKDKEMRRELAESKRLLYVASTRAKDMLVLSGIVNGKDPLNRALKKIDYSKDHWLKWTLGVLQQHGWKPEQEAVDVNGTLVQIGYQDYSDEEQLPAASEILQAEIDKQRDDETSEAQHVLPVEEIQRRWRLPELPVDIQEIKPSMLPDFQQDPENFYQTHIAQIPRESVIRPATSENRGTEYGSIAHQLLEKFVHSPDQDTERLIEQAIADFLPGQRQNFSQSLQEMLERLRQSDLFPLMQTAAPRTEVSFLTSIGGVPMTGQIDLLLHPADNQYFIVDYKTDAVDDSTIQDKTEHYAPQILAYAYAVQQSAKAATIKSAIYFTKPGRLVPVFSTPSDLESLEQLVRNLRTFVARRPADSPPG